MLNTITSQSKPKFLWFLLVSLAIVSFPTLFGTQEKKKVVIAFVPHWKAGLAKLPVS